jgi:hypothetical protein
MSLILPFLATAGWADTKQSPLAGDASARRYLRLKGAQGRAILMIAPPDQGQSFAAFLTIADYLNGLGLSAPEVLAADAASGLMLMEDLGDRRLARLMGSERNLAYDVAAAVLHRIAEAPLAPGIAVLNPAQMAQMTDLTFDLLDGSDTLRDAILPALAAALARHAGGAAVTALRDYHADNLIWLPDRAGAARVGLLDFQDAVAASQGYDLASLVDDVRRDVPAALRERLIADFATQTGVPPDQAMGRIDVLSLQRNLRILGVFRRLSLVGKDGYRRFLPRTADLIHRAVANPALTPMAAPVQDLLARTRHWAEDGTG